MPLHPGLVGALAGGGFGALGGRVSARDSVLDQDHGLHRALHREARRKGVDIHSKAYDALETKAYKQRKLLSTVAGGVSGAVTGGVADMHFNEAKRHQEYAQKAWKAHASANPGWEEEFARNYSRRYGAGAGAHSSHSSGSKRYAPPPHPGHHETHLKTLGLHDSVKTKDEVKKHFRGLAMKHHPDRGGDINKMKEINNAYDNLQKTPWFEKLAFLLGFHNVLGG